MAVSFIGGGNWSTRKKNPDLPQVTDKLYHIILYGVYLACARFELITLVVIRTDYIGSSKSNYHTINTTTPPIFQLYHGGHFIGEGKLEYSEKINFIT